jgi:hypothetical protein
MNFVHTASEVRLTKPRLAIVTPEAKLILVSPFSPNRGKAPRRCRWLLWVQLTNKIGKVFGSKALYCSNINIRTFCHPPCSLNNFFRQCNLFMTYRVYNLLTSLRQYLTAKRERACYQNQRSFQTIGFLING